MAGPVTAVEDTEINKVVCVLKRVWYKPGRNSKEGSCKRDPEGRAIMALQSSHLSLAFGVLHNYVLVSLP